VVKYAPGSSAMSANFTPSSSQVSQVHWRTLTGTVTPSPAFPLAASCLTDGGATITGMSAPE
ncbi:MAG TPA: hypothetical protein VN888_13275, partial [Mycobacterium sp.]|nr:hypothetical protein [Mycobacterium sp.]